MILCHFSVVSQPFLYLLASKHEPATIILDLKMQKMASLRYIS